MPSDGQTVPDVSVVTPSYGYAHYLRDAVDSVAEQRDITVEHVIQDGGSTDGTVELLRELDDVVDWASEPDEGQSDALNRGISRARGRWIAWLNADEFSTCRTASRRSCERATGPGPTSSTATRSSPTATAG